MVSIILKFYEKESSNNGDFKKTHLNMRYMICSIELEAEFNYWKIDFESHLDLCCLRDFEHLKEKTLDHLRTEREVIENLNFKENFGSKFFPLTREHIYYLMEVPRSSHLAKCYLAFSSFIILLSVIEYIVPESKDSKD